ncbi:AfsR/SARP family transcriptional regulator [Saccharothrix sp. NRRL B-16314]|uniref:AfsR/SARP family transcriptional regulator n=1 Tax=Saccharothrix sp. NRRL B-16314 TaxID=1463825 RepID=UPI0006921133|nr:BTAD domain-containing putative transcriptional regulator [Saccharothrix sp. NRRL B-16314]
MTGESEQGAPPDVAVGVLGNLEVRVDGASVPVGHARQKAVLAVLSIEVDRVVPPDRLIDRVWGEHAPARARSVLRTYLSNLRRALTSTGIAITWRDTGYSLTVHPDAVDLHRFRRLLAEARDSDDPRRALALADDALALWRGEPLAELDTPWAQSAREHLHRERAAAQADRIDWALDCGLHGDLLPELPTRAAEEPLDERLAGQLMLALYRSGRQTDALKHYQRTRQRLAEELGTDPCPDLQQLHQCVLTADPALTLPPVEAPRPVVVPRQLPAPPAPFVGRRDELDRLDTALNSSSQAATVVISALAGAGGIGKTWLALHWAHRNVDRFPDGQLFVDLRGFSLEGAPMDPVVAVRGFLEALGVDPDRIPVDPHAQAALFRSLAAGRRMLVVLDNAATTAQVTALLPGSATCTVVVTSRNRLPGLITGHGARHLPLDALLDDDARALLVDRLGTDRINAEPAAVDDLSSLCGGFPLALSIVAARAHFHPRTSLTTMAAELRDQGLDALHEGDPAASLPTVLSWSHDALTAEQARVFALLGIAPGPDISLPAAAGLTGLPPGQIRTELRRLEQASLIVHDSYGHYRMHDLIRRYAADTAQRLADTEKRAALRRVVDHYLHTAFTGQQLLDPHLRPIRIDPPVPDCHPLVLSDDAAALAWFDTEHACLLAAQQTAVAHGRFDAVWQLAWMLNTFHYRRAHRHDQVAAWQTGLTAARRLPDPAAEAMATRFLAQALADMGRDDEALDLLHHALAIAERAGLVAHLPNIHNSLSRLWEQRGDDRQALEYSHRALEFAHVLDDPVMEAHLLNNLGWSAARLGDYGKAREHCWTALTLHRQHGERSGEAFVLDSLGYIDHHTGRHEDAIHNYRQALMIRVGIGDAYEEANTYDALGHPYAALGQHGQARAVWQEALRLYQAQQRIKEANRVRRQLDALVSPTDTKGGLLQE